MTADPTGFRFPTSRIPFRDREGVELFPDGARVAFLFYGAAEQWNWGDEQQPALDPFPVARFGEKRLAQSMRSAIEYGFNVGLWRIAECLRDLNVKATFWTTGNAIEQYPEIVEMLHGEGHEIGAHGYSEGWPMTAMDRDGQADAIRRSVDLIRSVTGEAPQTWLGPGAGADRNTVELIAEAGFSCHGDFQDDELPYFLHVGDRTLVEIPYRMIGNLNDVPLLSQAGQMLSVPRAIEYLRESFDASYEEALRRPLMVNFGTHPQVIGRPDAFKVMREFMKYVVDHEGVWIPTYAELSAWWQDRFGPLVPDDHGDLDVSSLAAR
jgi:peptidoglycan/xylan/chitin deacetylase (PgdA/CDA1 family)